MYLATQRIFREGEYGNTMYVVTEGEVELSIKGRVFETVEQGGIFGELALVDNRPRSATATAKTNSRIVPIDEYRFKYLVQETPYFALKVMSIMAERLRNMNRYLDQNKSL